MKIIIDVSEELYETTKSLPDYMRGVYQNAIRNGKPLDIVGLKSEICTRVGLLDFKQDLVDIIDNYLGDEND